ncbi:LysR family transcriptional regulator [Pragia fontium]|uniref:DNA-binding transcriptional regulator, LysR family n=2 Tax=Pragia fontium TaxID=82985 RepID=A0AAJ5BG17_9GAMM|nr:LysR family transcriptional regulator [Pragia fontium]AKJ41144.1 transcriptional regulator [Pragia fontium]SFC12501.1 DNA-binding transcriptional regulator, LysR family [Pragia fontium DSM 5563 = ATCC 49100]SUB81351.1 HTH-type transcriptional activator AllS [Pragia fontium]VEJ53555.1 HTH-type transcriptional activator AllS [Pragia fontium]GKX63336.1 LysR family transcriptional regulator [Pragia fontium]
MKYSPEALVAFVEAASQGSFSAAARKLHKSQSTISSAIANLEIDLGLTLFDRSSRHPVLTPHGLRVLNQAKAILSASERLDELAIRLSAPVESRLSFVLSDTYQQTQHEEILQKFEQRYPDIEFECMIAEEEDVLILLQSGRAQIGLIEVQSSYPQDVGYSRLLEQTEMSIFVSRQHPLATFPHVTKEQLANSRQLCLNTYLRTQERVPQGLIWSAPSYLMLLEMAEQGFGWAVLPRWLVKQFSQRQLFELTVRGWPRMISVDAVWSKNTPPGPAGQWFLEQLLQTNKQPL